MKCFPLFPSFWVLIFRFVCIVSKFCLTFKFNLKSVFGVVTFFFIALPNFGHLFHASVSAICSHWNNLKSETINWILHKRLFWTTNKVFFWCSLHLHFASSIWLSCTNCVQIISKRHFYIVWFVFYFVCRNRCVSLNFRFMCKFVRNRFAYELFFCSNAFDCNEFCRAISWIRFGK